MKHTEIWYACQMLIYEMRLAHRASQSAPSKGKTTITVPWEIRK